MAPSEVPQEMQAVQVMEFNKPYKIHQVPVPKDLGPHELLIKTAVGSLCHTDSMVMEGKMPTKLPQTGSHEGTGRVVAVGDQVKGFKIGDRVMSGIPINTCGKCQNCKGPNDWIQYCPDVGGLMGVVNANGAWADYHVTDSRTSAHVPDNVSLADAAPLACAGVTIYRAIVVANVAKGGWLGIVGAGGGLGHLGIQMAQAQGLNVVAVDARDPGLELCEKAGAEHVFDARKGNDEVVKEVQAITPDNLGVDATINVSEHETAAGLSCAITKMHGTVVQVAQPPNVSVPFRELIFRDITIKGTLVSGQQQAQDMLDLVEKAGIKVETNLFYGLDEVPKMVELAHSGNMKGKAVCVVDKSQL